MLSQLPSVCLALGHTDSNNNLVHALYTGPDAELAQCTRNLLCPQTKKPHVMTITLAAAGSSSVRVAALGGKTDAGALSGSGVSGSCLVEWQLLRDGSEELCNVLGGLGGGLKEEEAGFARVGFGVGSGDGALVGLLGDEIQLVSGQSDNDILVGLALEFLDPGLGLV